MNPEAANDLDGFHRFIGDKLHSGDVSLTPEQVLDQWRVLHPESELSDEDTASIQEAIDDMADGDVGISWSDFDRDFRTRHGLSAT